MRARDEVSRGQARRPGAGRAAVAQWREQNPAGTADELIAALGSQFHSEYGPVLRGTLFRYDQDHTGSPTQQVTTTWDVFTGSATCCPVR